MREWRSSLDIVSRIVTKRNECDIFFFGEQCDIFMCVLNKIFDKLMCIDHLQYLIPS